SNIECYPLPFKGSFDLKTALGIKQLAKRKKADIVHLHTPNAHANGVWASLLGMRTPMILSRRVDFHLKRNRFTKFKYNYPGIKKIICVSNAIKDIVGLAVKEKDKIVTVYDCLDLKKYGVDYSHNFFREQFHVSNRFIIGTVAALVDHKDLFTFIDTAEVLIREKLDAKFFIVGQGDLKDQLTEYIKSKDLEQHVMLTGFLNNIPYVLKSFDLLLFTSKTEGLGSTILDAFASRIPVVATRAGGIPEIVTHGDTGLLAEVKDPVALAHHVKTLVTDDVLRGKLIAHAFERVKGFSKEKLSLDTLKIYQTVVRH
ncbi:MAG: glycosyltransferase, partial [Bacteroidota bacterium]